MHMYANIKSTRVIYAGNTWDSRSFTKLSHETVRVNQQLSVFLSNFQIEIDHLMETTCKSNLDCPVISVRDCLFVCQ